MLLKIRKRIEKELHSYLADIDKEYCLRKTSPFIFSNIQDFILRQGKRVRPSLFIIGYLGFAKEAAPGLYKTAVSLELLHDFMLVHDDIIDKSPLRRGKPSMHEKINRYLSKYGNLKFNGEDLALVIGDVMYAMAINSFLSVKENMLRKEMALKKLTEAAFYTGAGELIELIYGIKDIEKITKTNIYQIYDLKTAKYTFAYPLAIGATLAGAKKKQVDLLFDFGLYLGRAFQIKDDIIGMFETEEKIGKSTITDLQEAKKTILIWQAYHNSGKKNKLLIRDILAKEKVTKRDLFKIRAIVLESGAFDFAKNEIYALIEKAEKIIGHSTMKEAIRESLIMYARKLLSPSDTDKFAPSGA